MAKQPIEIMLDNIKWEPIEQDIVETMMNRDIPTATHQGILAIGDIKLRVYQLNNGQRVIEQNDLINLFKSWEGANG